MIAMLATMVAPWLFIIGALAAAVVVVLTASVVLHWVVGLVTSILPGFVLNGIVELVGVGLGVLMLAMFWEWIYETLKDAVTRRRVTFGVVMVVVVTLWITLSLMDVLPDWMSRHGCGEGGEFCEPLEGWER